MTRVLRCLFTLLSAAALCAAISACNTNGGIPAMPGLPPGLGATPTPPPSPTAVPTTTPTPGPTATPTPSGSPSPSPTPT